MIVTCSSVYLLSLTFGIAPLSSWSIVAMKKLSIVISGMRQCTRSLEVLSQIRSYNQDGKGQSNIASRHSAERPGLLLSKTRKYRDHSGAQICRSMGDWWGKEESRARQ
jgi:hypothetical protein